MKMKEIGTVIKAGEEPQPIMRFFKSSIVALAEAFEVFNTLN